jgi:prepilin-type N-terminal cleavage/methylation domain-containing protein
MIRLVRAQLQSQAGFTLIELMIVILVILLLAAILVPQFGIARERARKASCVSNQRNLETAVAMWATDNPLLLYDGGPMDGSTPGFAALTAGTPPYALAGAFQEPDDPNSAQANGFDYYLSEGTVGQGKGHGHGHGNAANPAAPSYGHVACNYADELNTSCAGGGDPWVNCYNGTGPGTGLDHTRGGAQAAP